MTRANIAIAYHAGDCTADQPLLVGSAPNRFGPLAAKIDAPRTFLAFLVRS